jgi:hypothetical protein
LISFGILEVLPDANTGFERSAGQGIQAKLRQIGSDNLPVPNHALSQQRLVNKSRAVGARKRDCRHHDIDVIRFSSRSQRVGHIRNLIVNLPGKNSRAGADDGFGVTKNIPRKTDARLKVIFIERNRVGFVLNEIAQTVI